MSNVNIHIIHRIQRNAAHLMSYCKGLCCQRRRALRELRVNKNITNIKNISPLCPFDRPSCSILSLRVDTGHTVKRVEWVPHSIWWRWRRDLRYKPSAEDSPNQETGPLQFSVLTSWGGTKWRPLGHPHSPLGGWSAAPLCPLRL